jgi:hypothetical protein
MFPKAEAASVAQAQERVRRNLYAERDKISQALQRGENPYGGFDNAVNSLYGRLAGRTGVSYEEARRILGEAYTSAGPGVQAAGRAANIDAVGGTAGGGGGGYYTPMVTANLSDRINALNQMYDLIYRDLSELTQSKRGELEKAYGEQQKGITGQYEETARALPLQYGAQGVGDSSYYSKAAGRASDVYNQNLAQMEQEKQSKLGELGKFYETTMGQFRTGQEAVGRTPRSITGTQADVQAQQAQLDQALQGLAGQRAGLRTNQQYVQALQGIAPSQNMGADMLKKQLDELAVSSIPSFAKQTIGKDIIQKSGQDQTFYQDYFDKLQQGQSTGV